MDGSVEIIQTINKHKKKISENKTTEQKIQLWDNIKQSNMYIELKPQKKRKRGQNKFKDGLVKIFPKVMKKNKPYICKKLRKFQAE